MTKKQQFMILMPSGDGGCLPQPLVWPTEKNAKVVIVNASGADQKLSNISDDLLKGDGGWVSNITISDGDFWSGKVGAKREEGDPGNYIFDDGEEKKFEDAPRVGTIDPS